MDTEDGAVCTIWCERCEKAHINVLWRIHVYVSCDKADACAAVAGPCLV